MIFMKQILIVAWGATMMLLISGPALTQTQADVDHTPYGELLSAHVKDGKVDYKGFKADAKQLDAYLAKLAEVDPDALDRSERMAFYINLYNAATIKLILTGYPGIDSIKDLGSLFKSPWKKKFVKLNGGIVTLDHIEHDILRPQFKDPRVHFAVNCASKSCPPLLAEPYTGAELEKQLDWVTRKFINDASSNHIKDGTLYVSRIFKWFGQDFDNDILKFFETFARDELAEKIIKQKTTLKIDYLDYDWSLNSI